MWQGGFLHPVMSISVFSMVPSPLCINPHIFNAVRLGLPPCRIYFAFSMCQGGFLHPTASIFALSTQLGGETNLSMSISHFWHNRVGFSTQPRRFSHFLVRLYWGTYCWTVQHQFRIFDAVECRNLPSHIDFTFSTWKGAFPHPITSMFTFSMWQGGFPHAITSIFAFLHQSPPLPLLFKDVVCILK